MLAEAVARAARGHVIYLELMLTPDGTTTGVLSSQIGDKVGWDGNFESTLSKLKANGIDAAAAAGDQKPAATPKLKKISFLKCGTPQADRGLLGCDSLHRASIARRSPGAGLRADGHGLRAG